MAKTGNENLRKANKAKSKTAESKKPHPKTGKSKKTPPKTPLKGVTQNMPQRLNPHR